MKRTPEEWVDHWSRALEAILFRGYFADGDPAMKFRKMKNESLLIRELMVRAHKETVAETTNGQPQTKEVKK